MRKDKAKLVTHLAYLVGDSEIIAKQVDTRIIRRDRREALRAAQADRIYAVRYFDTLEADQAAKDRRNPSGRYFISQPASRTSQPVAVYTREQLVERFGADSEPVRMIKDLRCRKLIYCRDNRWREFNEQRDVLV